MIVNTSSGSDLTSPLFCQPSFGAVAGLSVSMEPLTSRTSAYFHFLGQITIICSLEENTVPTKIIVA